MKKPIVIALLLLFTASNLLMPYANFDDTRSLQIVYNTCLATDADMNVMEFVGEKLLGMGFEGDEEEEETVPAKSTTPINTGVVIQIQSGAMYQQPQFVYTAQIIPVVRTIIPLINAGVPSADFHPAIFHPPTIVAA
ncbi:MAG: hypothetical protein WCP74_02050 [Sphingobacteriia bacterium]